MAYHYRFSEPDSFLVRASGETDEAIQPTAMKQTLYTKRDISILLKVPIETVEECIKKIYGKDLSYFSYYEARKIIKWLTKHQA